MTKKRPPTKKTTPAKPKPVLSVRGADVAADAREWLASFMPVERIPLSQFMTEEGRLEDGTKLQPYPFQCDIADAFTDYETEQVTVRKGSRVGYSTIVQSFLGYRIARDAARSIIYQPTIDDAENYSKDDLEPVLQWPCVRKVAAFKPRHRDNQIRAKRYRGGWIQIKGANSPKEFRRVSADDVILEEPDGYPPSAREEGDPARLAMRRNASSPRRFTAAGSTPKIKGASRIDALFELGTQEFRYVPCPHCGTMQILVFGDGTGPGVRWAPKKNPTRAWYRCVDGCDIEESHKAWMDEQGEFRAHNPEAGPRHRSFHIWAAYSQQPGAAWLVIAREFLEVYKDPNLLKTFVNQFLGEAWEETGEAPEWKRLYDRREKDLKLGTPPPWTGLLVGSVDVQSGGSPRLELDIWAFGPERRRALVEHIEVDGAAADRRTWDKLDKEIARQWVTEDGRSLRLERVAVDSGDGNNTLHVYAWARRNPGLVMAVKGRDSLAASQVISGPTWVEATINGVKLRRGVRLWQVGTSLLKLELYGQLHLEKPADGEEYPAGYVYLPDGTTDEWIKQLCAEELRTKKLRSGRSRREWVKTRDRNEALDNAVYARAVAVALGADIWTELQWKRRSGEFARRSRPAPRRPEAAPMQPPAQVAAQAAKSRRVNSLTGRARGSFLKGNR